MGTETIVRQRYLSAGHRSVTKTQSVRGPPALQLLASGAKKLHPSAQGHILLCVVELPSPDLRSPKEVHVRPAE